MGKCGFEFAPGRIRRWLNQDGNYGSSPPDGLLSPILPDGTRIALPRKRSPLPPATFLLIVAFAMTVPMIAFIVLPVITILA